MKKINVGRLFGAFALTAVLALSGCGGSTSEGESKEKTTEKIAVQNDASAPEDMTAPAQESTEGLNAMATAPETTPAVDCSFTLEGKNYTLPFDFSQLEADGWTTDTDMSQELKGYSYTFIHIKKDGKDQNLTIDIYNGTGNNKALKDCKVSEIDITVKEAETYSFALSNGLKAGDDQAAVTAAMGTPTDTSDSENSTSLYYGENRDKGQISFTWWKDADAEANGSNSISVAFFQREGSVSSSEVPAYLSEYQAPASMGDDFDSATFTLDGVVYKLPCPAGEFVKNGWTITDSEEVPAGRENYGGEMEKDGVKLQVNYYNYAEYQTTGENCAVSQIELSMYGANDPVPNLQLPKGISFGMKLADLETALSGSSVKFDKSDGSSSSVSYSYGDYDKGVEAYFWYNTEDDRLGSIKIGGKKWQGK